MWRSVFWVLGVAVLSAGCPSRPEPDTPPDMRYGEDACVQCQMIINEARYAAAYVTRQGTTRRFDDIGDMLVFHAAHPEDVAVFWVHDYETASWLRATQAYFVMSKALHTPMAHGVVALGTLPRAQALAAETQGEVLTFADLRQRLSAAGTAAQSRQHHHAPGEFSKPTP